MSMIIDGKALADKILNEIQEEVQQYAQRNIPALTVITIGDDPASKVYVNNKRKACERVGLQFKNIVFSTTDTFSTISHVVAKELQDEGVAGIIIQQPIISDVLTSSEKEFLANCIVGEKDVDGFGTTSQLSLYDNYKKSSGVNLPCTPLGIMYMIKDTLKTDDLSGLNVLIIGRSNIVGKPLAAMLLAENCTITMAHSKTKDLLDICRLNKFDIVVSAVGRANLLTSDYFPFYGPRIIIDVGINRDENNKLCGDISEKDKQSIVGYSGAYTPVPGGVGPMTVAMLIHNTWEAAKRKLKMNILTK